MSTIENISETRKIFISTGQPEKKSHTRNRARVVDTSLLFCVCEQLCDVLLRPKAVIELDLTSSISLRDCWLAPQSFQV